MNLATHGPVYM